MKFEQERIPLAVMKEVARQLLQGLDVLHRECGIIHTGSWILEYRGFLSHTRNLLMIAHKNTDQKPSNKLFELEYSEAVISRYPDSTSVRTSLSKMTQLQDINAGSEKSASPTPLSEAITTPLLSESDDFHVMIIDFGVCGLLLFLLILFLGSQKSQIFHSQRLWCISI